MDQDANKPRMNFAGSLKAGFLGAIVMTVIAYLMGSDLLKELGTTLLGSGAEKMKIYLTAGGVYLVLGMFFGFCYALFIAPMSSMGRLFQAILFGTILTALCYFGTPIALKKLEPYFPKTQSAAQLSSAASDPAAPASSPDEPGSMATKASKNPLIKSWIYHFIFALVLAVVYRPRRSLSLSSN